jgi:GntR family transcriptional regulator/MocR family aminotransferase
MVPVTRSNSLGREGFPADLLVTLEGSGKRGLRERLEHELRAAVQGGRLAPGTRLPPSRTLASDLGVSRTVVVEAYGHLVADGYLEARQGSGTHVGAGAAAWAPRPEPRLERTPIAQFIGGLPDPAHFPRREWQRHYRAALDTLPDAALGYPGPHGALPLRTALSSYLRRVRGVVGEPERMLVTTGFTQALVLVCRALRARGVEAMAVEDPCFGFHRQAIEAAGLRAVPVPVDEDGIDVGALEGLNAGAALVAPAHSYPSGAVLSAARRARLVAWARRCDGLIVEDDYDAEFRYDRAAVGALQGLAPDRVAYAGCASKTLSPALRLGWISPPDWLADDLAREKVYDDMGTGLLEQLALARLVERGGFTRHLRRVRPVYRRRRDTAVDAIAEFLPGATTRGVEAGLHVYVELPADCDEQRLVSAAREKGVLVEGGSWHWADPAWAPPSLVIGYGSMGEEAIRRGIALLGSADGAASVRQRSLRRAARATPSARAGGSRPGPRSPSARRTARPR